MGRGSWVRCHMPLIQALRRHRQVDLYKFMASLVYIEFQDSQDHVETLSQKKRERDRKKKKEGREKGKEEEGRSWGNIHCMKHGKFSSICPVRLMLFYSPLLSFPKCIGAGLNQYSTCPMKSWDSSACHRQAVFTAGEYLLLGVERRE